MSPENPSSSDADYLDSFLSAAFSADEAVDVPAIPGLEDAPVGREEPEPEILARYPIAERLGHGGVAIVYRAHDADLQRDVAIKVLRRKYAADPAAVERFLAEARVCSRLQQPGIVPIHELGTLADGRPYFTMKIVAGETLKDRLDAPGRDLAASESIEIFEKIAQTLAFAHAHGVIHGDLKPQNVMVGPFGEVQVMDWGFAREIDAPDRGAGRRRILGTPSYMAPEQAIGDDERISTRTDCFGLGAILCEILTGSPPYVGQSRSEILLRATKGWLEDARARLSGSTADPALLAIASRCLDPDPERRPRDASEVAEAARAYLTSLAQRARALEIEAAQARATAVEERRARRLTLALAVVGVLAVVLPGAVWIQGEHDRTVRRIEAERSVTAHIERARLLGEAAVAGGRRDPGAYGDALAAAREAIGLAAAPEVGDEVRTRANQVLASIEGAQQRAESIGRSIARLAALHPHGSTDVATEVSQGYRAAFLELGANVDDDPDGAVRALQGSDLRPEAVAALDQWTWVRRRADRADSAGWHRTLDVASRVDGDPFRAEVRDAIARGDVEHLKQLAADRKLERPAASLILLARGLIELGQREDAIRVYRTTSLRFPDDYWTSHDLASQLALLENPPLDEIVRLYSMALAARPTSAHALTDLGRALVLQKDRERGEEVLERAAELAPENGRVRLLLGAVAIGNGDRARGERYFREAVALGYGVAAVSLFGSCLARGDFAAARGALLSVNDAPIDDRRTAIAAANALVGRREFELADALLDRVLATSLDDETASRLRVFCAISSGRLDRAEAELDRARAAAAAGRRHFSREDEDLAGSLSRLRAAERGLVAMEADPTAPPIAAEVAAMIAFGKGDLRTAALRFEQAFDGDGRGPESFGFEPMLAGCIVAGTLSEAAGEAGSADAADAKRWGTRASEWLELALARLQAELDSGRVSPEEALEQLSRLEWSPSLRRRVDAAASGPAAAAFGRIRDRAVAGLPRSR